MQKLFSYYREVTENFIAQFNLNFTGTSLYKCTVEKMPLQSSLGPLRSLATNFSHFSLKFFSWQLNLKI